MIIDATTTQTKAYAGIGQYTKNLITEMIRGNPHDDFHLLLFDEDTVLSESVLELSNCHRVSLGSKPGKLGMIFLYLLRIRPALNRIIRESKSKEELVYFCPYFQNGFPVGNVKTVLAIHDFAMPEFEYYSDNGKLINWVRKKEYWYHMNRSEKVDAIVTDSESTATDYTRYFPSYENSKIYPILLGIELEEKDYDIDRYLPSDWRDRGYFIYLGGGIQKSKNSEGVIRAYKAFLDQFEPESPPYLVIAGKIFLNEKSPQSVKIMRLIDSLGIRENVYFSGYYEDSAKFSLISNSIAFLHLSLYEGFGIAVAEAMRSGAPVIAHEGSSYPEVVGTAGYLVDGSDPMQSAKVMLELYKDPAKRKEIGLLGRERSFMFDWKETAKKTMAVIKSV